jgi:hypothetical protein
MELPEEEMEILRKQAEKFEFDQLNQLFNLLLKGEEEMAQSTFPRTMLEMTLIRMATSRPLLPIDEILRKLETLGKGHPHTEPSPSTKVMDSRNVQMGKSKKEASSSGGDEEGKEKGYGKKRLSTEGREGLDTLPPNPMKEPGGPEKGLENEGVPPKVMEETWKGLVDFTRARNPIIGSFLALGSLVHFSEDKIEIGFEKDSFHYERIIEKENRNQLESICHEYFQKKAKVIISSLDQEKISRGRMVFEELKTDQDPSQKPLIKGGEGNSLIQEALRLFDGKIVER